MTLYYFRNLAVPVFSFSLVFHWCNWRVSSSDKMIAIYFIRLSKVWSILHHMSYCIKGEFIKIKRNVTKCFHILFFSIFLFFCHQPFRNMKRWSSTVSGTVCSWCNMTGIGFNVFRWDWFKTSIGNFSIFTGFAFSGNLVLRLFLSALFLT